MIDTIEAQVYETEESETSHVIETVQTTALADTSKDTGGMEKLMEMAKMLSKSTVVPVSYQNRPENAFVALDMANRTGLPVLAVMQNLFVIQGKPSWSGQSIASMIRTSSQFSDVELVYVGEEGKDTWGAYVTAIRTRTGKPIKGGTVSIATAKKEGWFQKAASKWQTMPELMLAYRAYAWFGRVYAPELMQGLLSREEVEDITVERDTTTVKNPYSV